MLLGSSLVSWQSKKQKVVLRSTAESELRSLADTTCELSWINLLLSELTIPQQCPIVLHCDNQVVLDIVVDPVFHPKTKHFAIDCHFIREQVQLGQIHPVHISSAH